MRGLTMTVLALCAMATIAEAETSNKVRPATPAPEVVIPRETPSAETPAVPAGDASQPSAPVETVQIPAETPTTTNSTPSVSSSSRSAPFETVTLPRQTAASSRTSASAPTPPTPVVAESTPASAPAGEEPAVAVAAPAYEAPPAAVSAVPAEPTYVSVPAAPVLTASATPPPASRPIPGTGFGADTRYWTSLQVSGAAAVKDERPLPGEVATKIYERYVNSFTHPIPEKYEQQSFSSSSGGGGGGGTR